MSVVVPSAPERLLITPPYVHWSQVSASDLIEVGPEAEDAPASGGLWEIYGFHHPAHAARPDVACVIHLHPRYGTALAALEDPRLQFVEQHSLEFYGRIAYSERYEPPEWSGRQQGDAIAAALGDVAIALLLRNHGVVVVGPTIAAAYTNAYMLERACRVQLLAMASGRPLRPVPTEAAEAVSASAAASRYRERHFEAMKRVLDATSPGYAG